MKFFSWISLILLIIGGVGIVTGVKTDDSMLVAMSAVCWVGTSFLELLVMQERLNDINCTKDDEVEE